MQGKAEFVAKLKDDFQKYLKAQSFDGRRETKFLGFLGELKNKNWSPEADKMEEHVAQMKRPIEIRKGEMRNSATDRVGCKLLSTMGAGAGL